MNFIHWANPNGMINKRIKDGDKVKSRAEVIIDNLLYDLGIVHEYEKALSLANQRLHPDWYLTEYNRYIEFWGMESNERYAVNQREKLKLYSEHNIVCLSLGDDDLRDRGELEKRIQDFIAKKS